MVRKPYPMFMAFVWLVVLSACGSHRDFTKEYNLPSDEGDRLTYEPRTAADPPYTVTSVVLDEYGTILDFKESLLDWQRENALVAARMARNAAFVSPDGIGVSEEELLQDADCLNDSAWFFSLAGLGGNKVCIAGAGQVYAQATTWNPATRGQQLIWAPLLGMKSIYPGSYKGIVSRSSFLPSTFVYAQWSSWGNWLNYDFVNHGAGGYYLDLGYAANGGNNYLNCGGHPICLTGSPPPYGWGGSECQSCVIPVVNTDARCRIGVAGAWWDSNCVAEAEAAFHAGQCDSPNRDGNHQLIPGCPND